MIMGMCIGCSPYNAEQSVITQAIAVLRRFGTDAHIYLPGVGMMNGLQAGNYLDSAGTTVGTVDQPVGLVLDAAGGLGVNAVVNGALSSGLTGWAAKGAGASITWNPSGNLSVQATQIYGGARYTYPTQLTIGNTYIVELEVVSNNSGILSVGWNGVFISGASLTIGKNQYIATCTSQTAYIDIVYQASSGIAVIDNISVREVTGIAASQPTTSNKCILRQTGGRYNWVFDATDLLTATFPAGNESVTVIDALGTGQVTTTGVNVVGAYSMGPSVTLYGRMIIRVAVSPSDLALLQGFANRLAGL